MNDSYSVLADMYTALAAERTRSMLTEAHDDGLARQARCSSPHRLTGARTHLVGGLHRVGRAGHASMQWLRKGQLAGYASTCTTC
jgi:hypothetical protein